MIHAKNLHNNIIIRSENSEMNGKALSFGIQDLLGLREKSPEKLPDSDPVQGDPLPAQKTQRKRRRQAVDSVGEDSNSSESEGKVFFFFFCNSFELCQ